jgi:hypothetical protein
MQPLMLIKGCQQQYSSVKIIFRIPVYIETEIVFFCKKTQGCKSAAAAAASTPDIQNIETHARKLQVYDQQRTVRCGKAY